MTNDEEKAGNIVSLRFNSEEWGDIQRGAKLLYADEMISKPTAYSFLKWCGLMVSESLEKKHGGDND